MIVVAMDKPQKQVVGILALTVSIVAYDTF